MNETIKWDSTNFIVNSSPVYRFIQQVELTDECIQEIAERVVELIKDGENKND